MELKDQSPTLELPKEPAPELDWRVWSRWLVWTVFVAVWTFALLVPRPHRFAPSEAVLEYQFSISKTLHVTAYALFAVLSAALPVSSRRRWRLVAFMSAHAFFTEFGQIFAEERHPSLRDVGIDHVGMVLGMLLSWKWWRRQP
jgi:VanZ family protein